MSEKDDAVSLIARPQLQVLKEIRTMRDEMGTMRDDMGVMMALMLRMDGTMSGLVNEVRAMHSRHSRLATRVHALEQRAPRPDAT